MEINKEQLCAIQHGEGPMMVLAGPGSGKTFVITRRIQNLIENYKIAPETILVITFTKAASLEMQERFNQLMNEPVNVTFGTFHAIYFQILKAQFHYDNSNILTDREKKRYLKEVLSTYPKEETEEQYLELLITLISQCKNDGSDPLTVECNGIDKEVFASIYQDYQQLLDQEQKLDFDDMVLKCRDMFLQYPDILEVVRKRYQFLLVDEFQDINPMQYEVLKMIASPGNNLFIVGDDDQSIYGFRGSKPEIMLHFTRDWEQCKRVVLKNNYRSSDGIVQHALNLVEHNEKRFKKSLVAGRKGENDVVVKECKDREQEAQEVLEIIKHSRKIVNYSDIAIIFRTNAGARYLSTILGNAKIPFFFREKMSSIFSHPIALDVMAMLAFANGERTRTHFLRFMNKPVRYLNRNLLKSADVNLRQLLQEPDLKPYVKSKLKELDYHLQVLSKMHPYAAINYIRKGIGYEDYVVREAREKKQDRSELLEIMNLLSESAKNVTNYREWCNYIEEYEAQIKRTKTTVEEDSVQLVTMHGSKGLEYKIVIIPDINEGNTPQKKAEKKDEVEEERRMFYVAMTRAKDKLFLLYVGKTKENRLLPSRFLKELQ